MRTLVERALALAEGGALIQPDRAVERFEAHYAQTVGTDARLFAGVLPGLRRFAEAGIAMSVVTNKPRFFTEMLLERTEIKAFFKGVVAGDDGIRRKPHGDMLLAACERMGTAPAASLMLGDSDNDVIAARAAGCPVWCVPYGYNEGRGPRRLPATGWSRPSTRRRASSFARPADPVASRLRREGRRPSRSLICTEATPLRRGRCRATRGRARAPE